MARGLAKLIACKIWEPTPVPCQSPSNDDHDLPRLLRWTKYRNDQVLLDVASMHHPYFGKYAA